MDGGIEGRKEGRRGRRLRQVGRGRDVGSIHATVCFSVARVQCEEAECSRVLHALLWRRWSS